MSATALSHHAVLQRVPHEGRHMCSGTARPRRHSRGCRPLFLAFAVGRPPTQNREVRGFV